MTAAIVAYAVVLTIVAVLIIIDVICTRRATTPIPKTDFDLTRIFDKDGKPCFPGTYVMREGDARHRCTRCHGVLRTYADKYLGVCLACEEAEEKAE